MNRYWMVLICTLGLTACGEKNAQYYLSHPRELQNGMKACSTNNKDINCAEINELGVRMNNLAYQLQISPQGFGNKIMQLQETIASQHENLKKEGANVELKKSLEQNEYELKEYLAVVKWLESPES